MDIEHLIHMANRIGQFFEAFPDQTQARAGIAQHIAKFWAPRMREELLAHVDASSSSLSPLSPLVMAAVQEHRASLQRKPGPGIG